ncbi:MAG: hypothetical protein MUO62_16175 [Anaerolineales bacterium]|nr:hypothetical protein [Anaerolineales bacterium]
MPANIILILSYIAFIWLVVLHTFDEIACGIMEMQVGHIQMTKNRYLLAASAISMVNLGTLALLVLGLPAGYYLGLFTTAILGVFQALVHSIGYLRENKNARGIGAGFYSSIPLAIVGLIVFIQLIQRISSL